MQCQSITQRWGNKAVYDDPNNPKKVTGTTRVPYWDATMTAVYSDGENAENKAFWEATPSGEFKVATVKHMPWEPGKFYYLDVTEVPD